MDLLHPPVISSLLETDLYKFTMLQAMLHQFPANQARYEFVCRNTPQYPLSTLLSEVNRELDALCTLRFTEEELDYLRGLRYLKSDFVDFLAIFQLQRRFISAWAEGETLRIVAQGPQVHVMLFEIYVLAIVNELYFRRIDQTGLLAEGQRRLDKKIEVLAQFQEQGPKLANSLDISDFGLRRRFSGAWQEQVVRKAAAALPSMLKGTSNVYLAKKLSLEPIGTMAHEYLQTFQAVGVQLRNFQKAALDGWVREYRGDLGIALTDVVGMDAFLRDFDLFEAKLFDGLRHDSGDPIEWGEKALAHYAKLRINPQTKRLVFSDGLTIPKVLELYQHFANRIPVAFGIGTNLTNDMGVTPLNIVMKLTLCNGQPTAKLSDSPGKTFCEDQTFLAYLRQVFNEQGPAA
jgi:nicotinate phosphoribosyltransferase